MKEIWKFRHQSNFIKSSTSVFICLFGVYYLIISWLKCELNNIMIFLKVEYYIQLLL